MSDIGGTAAMDLGFPYWLAHRRNFEPHDPFFAAGSIEREFLAKQVALDLIGDERPQLEEMEAADDISLFCPIVGCGVELKTLEDFEDHYNARHTASCSVCSRVYPTSRLLSIHVSETHDSFFQAKAARGFPMYECLVEGCGMKLKSYESRQQHLVDKHKFPTSFKFFKKAHPSKQDRHKRHVRQSHNRRQDMKGMDVDTKGNFNQQHQKHRHKHPPSHKREEVKEMDMEVEENVDKLASAVSMLTTSDSTPSSISFGHRHARGLTFIPRSVQNQKNKKKHVDSSNAEEKLVIQTPVL